MAGTDYLTLYALQDLVLDIMFRTEKIFYQASRDQSKKNQIPETVVVNIMTDNE
jgi:hypothetical protein